GFIQHHGDNSSPLLAGGKFMVQMRELIAFNASTGNVDWRMPICRDEKLYGDSFHDSLLPLPSKTPADQSIYAHGQIIRVSDGKKLWEKESWKEGASIPTPIIAE